MWQVTYKYWGSEALLEYLGDGWEPFAVTCLGNIEYAIVWLRKKKEGML